MPNVHKFCLFCNKRGNQTRSDEETCRNIRQWSAKFPELAFTVAGNCSIKYHHDCYTSFKKRVQKLKLERQSESSSRTTRSDVDHTGFTERCFFCKEPGNRRIKSLMLQSAATENAALSIKITAINKNFCCTPKTLGGI